MYFQKFEIPRDELDSQYQHLHHAKILSFLEKGRLGYLEWVGHPNEALIANGIFIVIRKIDIKYRREIFAGLVDISCEEVSVRGRLILMKQRVIDESGKLLVIANFELVCVSGEQKRAIAVPEYLSSAFRAKRG